MERLKLNPDLLREAFRAKRLGSLQLFLEDLDPTTARHIKLAVTPGRAVRVYEEALITDIPAVNPGKPEGTNTWSAHKKWLMRKVETGALPESAIIEIETSTARVGEILANPELEKIYGLVVGYVQSGKTAHFTGVMSRAADLGFTFIIVLSGVLNDLRRQTQLRLVKDIIGDHPGVPSGLPEGTSIPIGGRPYMALLTSPDKDGDVKTPTRDALPDRLDPDLNDKNIQVAVVKKHTTVLEHLRDGIIMTDPKIRAKHRVLIIDDEADYATVNTGGRDELEDSTLEGMAQDDEVLDPKTHPTRTNRAVRRILSLFEKTAYIGYTATPFANVLIEEKKVDPQLGQTLYPRNFIMSLKRPEGYFGPDTFFGNLDDPDDERQHLVEVSESEARVVHDMQYDPDSRTEDLVPEALQNAIMDFFLTGAVRELRRRNGRRMNPHHTMLVHVTRLSDDQQVIKELIEKLVELWKSRVTSTLSDDFRNRLRLRWESQFSDSFETWSDFEEVLMDSEWLESIEVLMINYLSKETLDYEGESRNIIAVGGNKLSRGLTLEGLCISFFLRETKLYDSLMQMGRWFGYRHGYEDLVRVHSTPTLIQWYSWLVRVEDEVRADIKRYELYGKTPRELSVRIPLHNPRDPSHGTMTPTSRGKMKSAITSIVHYGGRTVQSIRLPQDQPSRLKHNLEQTTSFLNRIGEPVNSDSGRMAHWTQVDPEEVARFISSMDLDGPPIAVFDRDSISSYILDPKNNLENFTVAHVGSPYENLRQTPPDPATLEEPDWPVSPRYIARSQRRDMMDSPTNDLRVISEPGDFDRAEGIDILAPILLVYLVAPGSVPRGYPSKQSNNRMPLEDHGIPIVGVALKFPGEINGIISRVIHVRDISGELDG